MHGGSMHGGDASMIFSTSPTSTIDLPPIASDDEEEDEFEAELGCLNEIATEYNTAVATVLSTTLVGRKVQYRQPLAAGESRAAPPAMMEAEVVRLSAMAGAGTTRRNAQSGESPRHGCQLTLRLADGALVESSPSHVLPAEEAIAAAEGTDQPQPRSHSLTDLAMFIVSKTERSALEFRLRAATFVVAGSWVIQLNCGSKASKRKFFKASSRSGTLCWGHRHQGKMVRADATPYPELRGATPRNGGGEHLLASSGSAERACSFTVLLQYQTIYLLAPSEEEKQMWVAGINTLLSGLYF